MASSSPSAVTSIITQLKSKWPVKDLGEPRSLLGVAANKASNGFMLDQTAAIDDVVATLPEATRRSLHPVRSPVTETGCWEACSGNG